MNLEFVSLFELVLINDFFNFASLKIKVFVFSECMIQKFTNLNSSQASLESSLNRCIYNISESGILL
jgi:hypothetical protein